MMHFMLKRAGTTTSLVIFGSRGAQKRCTSERGVAALEFALVMPTVLVLLLGIATFGSALYSKQLLYDIAGEVARACVLKNIGGDDDVLQCVQSVGSYLASSGQIHSEVCIGQPVVFFATVSNQGGGQTPSYQSVTEQIQALTVTATCNWTFAPGFIGLLPGSVTASGPIYARASMPLLLDTSPL